MLFTIGAAVVTGLLFGLLPALRGARSRATLEFSRGSIGGIPCQAREGRSCRFEINNVLVIMQVALSIVMLAGGGVLLRTLDKLRNMDPGFDIRNILMLWVDPTLVGYEKDRLQNLYADLQQRLAALPGVTSATYSLTLCWMEISGQNDAKVEGQTKRQTVETQVLSVGPQYFEMMRMPLLRVLSLGVGQGSLEAAPQLLRIDARIVHLEDVARTDLSCRGALCDAMGDRVAEDLARRIEGMLGGSMASLGQHRRRETKTSAFAEVFCRSRTLSDTLNQVRGGGRGIRTPVTREGKAVFKTACFNHSHIPPHRVPSSYIQRLANFRLTLRY